MSVIHALCSQCIFYYLFFFFFQAEDGIRDLYVTGVQTCALPIFRGCWHRKMSWPVRYQEHSYQVCLGCGIKRLFDERSFRAYGPYSYDLNQLIAKEAAARHRDEEPQQRPA